MAHKVIIAYRKHTNEFGIYNWYSNSILESRKYTQAYIDKEKFDKNYSKQDTSEPVNYRGFEWYECFLYKLNPNDTISNDEIKVCALYHSESKTFGNFSFPLDHIEIENYATSLYLYPDEYDRIDKFLGQNIDYRGYTKHFFVLKIGNKIEL